MYGKEDVLNKRTCGYEKGDGLSNFRHFGAYVVDE